MPDWVHTASGWAIVHKDHITLLAALVSGFAAVVVMFLTIRLATDNRLLRKAGTEPEVVAYLLTDDRHINILNLVVANVGRGPARNVELEFIGELELLHKQGARLLAKSRLPILPWLPQDERSTQMFGNCLDLFNDSQPPAFMIKVHFEDLAGKARSSTSRINIADFEGFSRIQRPEDEMAEALKQIAKNVEGWGGFRRLRIETKSAAEVAREEKANYAAAIARRATRDDGPTN